MAITTNRNTYLYDFLKTALSAVTQWEVVNGINQWVELYEGSKPRLWLSFEAENRENTTPESGVFSVQQLMTSFVIVVGYKSDLDVSDNNKQNKNSFKIPELIDNVFDGLSLPIKDTYVNGDLSYKLLVTDVSITRTEFLPNKNDENNNIVVFGNISSQKTRLTN